MATITELLKREIAWREKDSAKWKAQLAENYVYYLSYVGEDLWRNEFKLDWLRASLGDDETVSIVRGSILHYLAQLQDYISRPYNVREESTGAIRRETAVWKYISSMELIEILNRILNEKEN